MPTGVVIKSTGKYYDVMDLTSETLYVCSIKGKFRVQGIKTTNPIAVGDKVDFELNAHDEGVISSIHARQNYIIRKSVNLSKQAHIIASNIDQCLLVVTLNQPRTSTGFIDRFLVTAEAYNVPVVIVFNKSDLLDDEDRMLLKAYEHMYSTIGYSCLITSVKTREGIDELEAVMNDKVNMIAGHSGVGKSSLVNEIEPGLELRTSSVSEYHHKGQHTTTFAEMHRLSIGGFIIDTPGIKGFGLVDIEKENLHHYFPEIFKLSEGCKFNNCVHMNEPGCAVKQAIGTGVSESRYTNYLQIYEDIESDETYRIDPYK